MKRKILVGFAAVTLVIIVGGLFLALAAPKVEAAKQWCMSDCLSYCTWSCNPYYWCWDFCRTDCWAHSDHDC